MESGETHLADGRADLGWWRDLVLAVELRNLLVVGAYARRRKASTPAPSREERRGGGKPRTTYLGGPCWTPRPPSCPSRRRRLPDGPVRRSATRRDAATRSGDPTEERTGRRSSDAAAGQGGSSERQQMQKYAGTPHIGNAISQKRVPRSAHRRWTRTAAGMLRQ